MEIVQSHEAEPENLFGFDQMAQISAREFAAGRAAELRAAVVQEGIRGGQPAQVAKVHHNSTLPTCMCATHPHAAKPRSASWALNSRTTRAAP